MKGRADAACRMYQQRVITVGIIIVLVGLMCVFSQSFCERGVLTRCSAVYLSCGTSSAECGAVPPRLSVIL